MESERIFRESDGIFVTDEKGNRYVLFPVDNFPARASIFSTLVELGIPQNLNGFKYIITAVELLKEVPEKYAKTMVANLYADVAKVHNTTWRSVERSTRYAMAACTRNAKYTEIFGNVSKVTVSRFLIALANCI